jgi:predicted anti-sigma-YlaC factor YlaD
MKCSEARRLQPRFFALELPATAEAAVREHLETCEPCRESFATSEPAFALAWTLGRSTPSEAPGFVTDVLAGIRQRRFERRVATHRRRWLTAAAAALLFVATAVTVREARKVEVAGAPTTATLTVAHSEAPLVDIEGKGVRVYEITGSVKDTVRVAFVVDPNAEF